MSITATSLLLLAVFRNSIKCRILAKVAEMVSVKIMINVRLVFLARLQFFGVYLV